MTSVEFTLLLIILILIIILIQQKHLENIVASKFNKYRNKINKISKILEQAYNIFKKARYFSLVNIFKNRFYKFYLIVAMVIVAGKIILHFEPQLKHNLPVLVDKSINFLIVSSVWEIICVVTKVIDKRISKK